MRENECKVCGETKNVLDFDKHYSKGPYEPWNLRCCKRCSHERYLNRYAEPKSRKEMQRASVNWKKVHPQQNAKLAMEYRKRHPEKITAQNRLNYAVRMGRIQRQPCEVCGTVEKVHAHHVSYKPEHWFDVRWLCYVCHKLEQSS